jgi:hypothetical protein
MSDRKYRQRGYQDDPPERDRQGPRPDRGPGEESPGSRGRRGDHDGPKTPNLMSSHEVFRCSRCGNRLALPVELGSRCSRCGVDLHSCIQCAAFDTGARFECMHPIPARVSPKDTKNVCTLFTARTTVERQTGTPGPTGVRQAFDDLFK